MDLIVLAGIMLAQPAVPAPKAPAPAPAKAVPAPAVAQPKAAGTPASFRVRVVERVRTADGPVRRLARALRLGCP